MDPLILARSLKAIENIYDESMYGDTDIFRIKDIVHSMDSNQWKCKQWLADTFSLEYGYTAGRVLILGGWYGLAAYQLRRAFPSDHFNITSIDMDPRCEEIGFKLFYDQNIEFVTQDVNDGTLDLSGYSAIITTSAEHIDRDDLCALVAAKDKDAWLLAQSNNLFDHPSHINCSNSVDEFAEYLMPHLPRKYIAYKGMLNVGGFKRFMVMAK